MAEGITPPTGIDFSLLETGTSSLVKNYAISKAGTWILLTHISNADRAGQKLLSIIQSERGEKDNDL